MEVKLYDLKREHEYNMAGSYDLIKLIPLKGCYPVFLEKHNIKATTWAIVNGEHIHISGATGTAKSTFIEAITKQPDNFKLLCKYLKFKYKPIALYEFEAAVYETPGEFYKTHELENDKTMDIASDLVKALCEASTLVHTHYPVIYIKEIGRVHSASVQGGLLNLLNKSEVVTPTKHKFNGKNICFVADSNYASNDSDHTLVQLDPAVRRRFPIRPTFDYYPEQVEIAILQNLLKDYYSIVDSRFIENLVRLGNAIRQYKAEGQLNSVGIPTIPGYIACYKMTVDTQEEIEIAIKDSLMGHANSEDIKLVNSILQNILNTPKSQTGYLDDLV